MATATTKEVYAYAPACALAASLLPSQRTLLSRYVCNALSSPERRAVRAENRKFSELVSTAPAAQQLLLAAGFAAAERDGARYFVVPDGDAADARLRAVQCLLDACTPSLFSLPDELLYRILGTLGAQDLSALQRASARVGRQVAAAGHLWLRFCPARMRREAREAARAASLERVGGGHGVDWRLVCRMLALWERLLPRCNAAVAFSLRDGLPLAALARTPPPLLARLPPAVCASLLVHDGQVDGGHAGLGLLFAGARLLSLEEIVAAAPELPDSNGVGGGAPIPLTTTVGFQCVAVRADGRVCMCAGFNEHEKARDWPAFLERVLWDTV